MMQASPSISRSALCSRQCHCAHAFTAALPARLSARRLHRAKKLHCRAALDSNATLAVTQQGVAFGG